MTPEQKARLEQERLQREQEEEQRRQQEFIAQQQARMQQAQSQPHPAENGLGGMNPGSMMSMMQSFGGGGSGAAAGGATSGGAAAGGTAAGGTGAAASGSAGSGLAAAWPVAVAVGIAAHHNWARKKGLHTNQDALTGRALYKDSEYYQTKGNEKLDGMGDEMRLAAMGSSPADLFRKETWTTAAKLAAQGGILGKALKKIF
jgi:hypothetical protein